MEVLLSAPPFKFYDTKVSIFCQTAKHFSIFILMKFNSTRRLGIVSQ